MDTRITAFLMALLMLAPIVLPFATLAFFTVLHKREQWIWRREYFDDKLLGGYSTPVDFSDKVPTARVVK